MELIFFETPAEFRKWLELNHKLKKEVFVGYYKKASGKATLSWSESVDEAICYGWIDGVRRSIDSESYCNRFTPRRADSNWSAVNLQKVDELIEQGRMQAAGLEIYKKRKIEREEVYSYENKPEALDAELETYFKSEKKAFEFFSKQGISYKKTMFYWIMSGKQEKTRYARLLKLIEASGKGLKIR